MPTGERPFGVMPVAMPASILERPTTANVDQRRKKKPASKFATYWRALICCGGS